MVQVRGRRQEPVLRPRPGPPSPRPPGHIRVYVVRHAEAGEREKWTGPDQLRPITGEGWRQARALAGLLEGVGQILSSPYLRCRQTVEPLAERLGLRVEIDDLLAEETPFAEALGLIQHARVTTAMSTHGDIVDELVAHLQSKGLVGPAPGPSRKGSTWSLDLDSGQVVAAAYLPPPA